MKRSAAYAHYILRSPRMNSPRLMRYATDNLAAAGRDCPIIAYEQCDDPIAFPGDDEQDVHRWQAAATLLLTREGAWRKQFTERDGFPPEPPARKHIAPAWKERARTLIALLAENDTGSLCEALGDVLRLPPATYTNAQWEVLRSITRLLPHAVAQLKLVFQSRNQVDFTEIAQGAMRALGVLEAPTDFAVALDYRIRHFLIDEFQDTSISQYELIEKLTAGWEPGEGRSMLAVGDLMQSIYRFQGNSRGWLVSPRPGCGNWEYGVAAGDTFGQFPVPTRDRGLGELCFFRGNAEAERTLQSGQYPTLNRLRPMAR